MSTEFETVIGLEVHVQLATKSKLFCGCRARIEEKSVSEEEVNTHTCPVCTGQPGALPVLNQKAVEFAVMTGLATHCSIREKSVFARKNYFYPDLPKGYQISQHEFPICENGWLDIRLGKPNEEKKTKRVELERIHIEEDAGKNVHMSGFSLVNLNRSSVPLIEIVSRPDMRSPEEAGAYLKALYSIVTSLGVCDGNLQEGNFRCDANVSVRPLGQEKLGTRAEVKNVNSFKFVEKAIEYEVARQIEVIRSGGQVVQETRNYDAQKNITTSLRSKEEAHDYRYFPDPDLVPLVIEKEWIDQVKNRLPELPEQKRARFESEYSLSEYDATVLTASRTLAEYFEQAVELFKSKSVDRSKAMKSLANLMTGELFRLVNDEAKDVTESLIQPSHLAEVVEAVESNQISKTNAKKVIAVAWESGAPVAEIIEKEGLKQVSDTGALEPVIDEIIANHPKQVEQYRGGKDKLLGFFVGQAMKATRGQANPALLQDLVKKKLDS